LHADEIVPKMMVSKTKVPALATGVVSELTAVGKDAPERVPDDIVAWETSFDSPSRSFLPECCEKAFIRVLMPPAGVKLKGACVMLPATGDMGYRLREKLYARTLAMEVCLPFPCRVP
jgi:hypothetical protein